MKRFPYILLLAVSAFVLPSCNSGGDSSSHAESEEHHHHEEGEEIELTQARMDAVGIRLGGFEKKDMAESVFVTGRLETDPQDEAVVTPKIPGRVTRICVVEGQKVRKGEIIAYVEAPEVNLMREEYRLIRQEVEAARIEMQRQQSLAAQGAGVRKNLDYAISQFAMAQTKLEGSRMRLLNYGVSPDSTGTVFPVRSEIAGTVVKVEASIGSFADLQIPVATVVNTSHVYCMLQVLEKDLGAARQGTPVEMKLTNDPSQRFTGRIIDINPNLNPTSRTVPVRVMIDRPADDSSLLNLIPGMAVSAEINGGGDTVDVLPEEAVIRSNGRSFIFVLEAVHDEDGEKAYHFEKVEVSAGVTVGGFTEVAPLEPLDPDARIVVAGAFYLNSMQSDHGEHSH